MRLEIMYPSVKIILVFIPFHLVNSGTPWKLNSGKNQVIKTNEIQSSIKKVQAENPEEENVQQFDPQLLPIVSSSAEIHPDKNGRNFIKGFHKNVQNGRVQLLTSIKNPLSASKVSYVQDTVALQWPLGVVPYFIDRETYDPPTVKQIEKMMDVVESSSCMVFNELDHRPQDSEFLWLHINNPDKERECMHDFSYGDNGEINLVLGFECLYPHEILHSILHGIGLKDEVAHPHRDQYIRILWENIQPKYRPLYRIQFEDAPYRLVEYDPMSIMHFHGRAFSINGAATIVPLIFGLQINPGNTLSPLDEMKLKLAFSHECNKRKVDDLLDSCKNALLAKEEHSDTGNEDYHEESGETENTNPPNNSDEERNSDDTQKEVIPETVQEMVEEDSADRADLEPEAVPQTVPENMH